MKIYILFLLCIIMLISCTGKFEVNYHKDIRTGLCYGIFEGENGEFVTAVCVPCDSVEQLIEIKIKR